MTLLPNFIFKQNRNLMRKMYVFGWIYAEKRENWWEMRNQRQHDWVSARKKKDEIFYPQTSSILFKCNVQW